MKSFLADIAPNCLEICKKRFHDKENVEYKLIETNIDFIPENSVDYVWSYDVFVHINPSDTKRYIKNFARVLKKGGIGIIHHAGGEYASDGKAKRAFRAKMTADTFSSFVEDSRMQVLEQNRVLVHMEGDIITVFQQYA